MCSFCLQLDSHFFFSIFFVACNEQMSINFYPIKLNFFKCLHCVFVYSATYITSKMHNKLPLVSVSPVIWLHNALCARKSDNYLR